MAKWQDPVGHPSTCPAEVEMLRRRLKELEAEVEVLREIVKKVEGQDT
jgi:hypothetical protein